MEYCGHSSGLGICGGIEAQHGAHVGAFVHEFEPVRVTLSRDLVMVPWCVTHDKAAVWGEHRKKPDGDLDFDDFTFTSCEFGSIYSCIIRNDVAWKALFGGMAYHGDN